MGPHKLHIAIEPGSTDKQWVNEFARYKLRRKNVPSTKCTQYFTACHLKVLINILILLPVLSILLHLVKSVVMNNIQIEILLLLHLGIVLHDAQPYLDLIK